MAKISHRIYDQENGDYIEFFLKDNQTCVIYAGDTDCDITEVVVTVEVEYLRNILKYIDSDRSKSDKE